MKGAILAALSLLQVVTAQPHGHKNIHQRDETTAAVVVWVDEDGQPVTIETQMPTAAATAAPVPQHATADSSSSSSSLSLSFPSGLGVCYSPYNSDDSCKSQGQVSADVKFLSENNYTSVRIYGVDCNQVATVNQAVQEHDNMTIFAGLLTITDVVGDLTSMMDQLHDIGGLAKSAITTISIGNELVDTGKATPEDVVAALDIARDFLSQHAPYADADADAVSLVTVDTSNAMIEYPQLCTASDFCAANAHPFFDPTVDPDGAGDWVRLQARRIRDAVREYDVNVNETTIVITECGWPHASSRSSRSRADADHDPPADGYLLPAGIPSLENQRIAIKSLKTAGGFGREEREGSGGVDGHNDDGDDYYAGADADADADADDDDDDDDDDDESSLITQLFLFSAFDHAWKEDGEWGVEKYWGILDVV